MAASVVTKLLKDYSRQVMGFGCGFQCRYVPQLVGTVQVGEDGEMVEVNGGAIGDPGTRSRLVIDSSSASETALFLILSHVLPRSSNGAVTLHCGPPEDNLARVRGCLQVTANTSGHVEPLMRPSVRESIHMERTHVIKTTD